MKIQEILGAYLSVHGQHEAAAEAYETTDRSQWQRLADLTIRTAPESERTSVAWRIKLEMDKPENGGAGLAADFEIRKEKHPISGDVWYRAYKLTADGAVDVGFFTPDPEILMRRVVGAFVVREFKVA